MDIDALVVREGDRVRASGRLVRTSQGDWFQPALLIAEPGGLPPRVRPVWSKGAVRVIGADFDTVSHRFEDDTAVEGWALVTGLWSGGQLTIERQAPPAPHAYPRTRWVIPPCPPPPGGWPQVTRRGDILLDYDLGDLLETGAVVTVTVFRPADNHPVLVVAASDVAAAEARLRPQLGESLCIVPARWAKAQLDAVRDHLHQHHEQWSLYQWGPQNTGDGQAHMAARLVRVLPEIAAWAATLPPDILLLEPWLVPLRPGAAENRGLMPAGCGDASLGRIGGTISCAVSGNAGPAYGSGKGQE
jgi:hypothetical protein